MSFIAGSRSQVRCNHFNEFWPYIYCEQFSQPGTAWWKRMNGQVESVIRQSQYIICPRNSMQFPNKFKVSRCHINCVIGHINTLMLCRIRSYHPFGHEPTQYFLHRLVWLTHLIPSYVHSLTIVDQPQAASGRIVTFLYEQRSKFCQTQIV